MRLTELETPVPLVDLDVLERKLDRMASYAKQHGLVPGWPPPKSASEAAKVPGVEAQ